jgi:hypothetical protein
MTFKQEQLTHLSILVGSPGLQSKSAISEVTVLIWMDMQLALGTGLTRMTDG